MNLNYLVKINGVIIPKVKSCGPGIEDMDSNKTKRNANGGLIRYRVARIPSLELEVGYLTQSEMQQVLRLLANDSFIVEWFDPELGGYRTGKFYAGKHKPYFYSASPIKYKPMKFTLNAYVGV